MDLTSWECISRWSIRLLFASGILVVIFTFLMHTADKKISELHRENDRTIANERYSTQLNIQTSTNKYAQEIYDTVVSKGDKDEFTLRKSAYEENKNKNYFKALELINQAIEGFAENAKNFAVRSLIYTELYRNFRPFMSSTLDEVKVRESNRWYDKGISDYQKVIELTEGNDNDLFVLSKVNLELLKSEKADDYYFSDKAIYEGIYAEVKKELNLLLEQFPDNEVIIDYLKLINRNYSSNKEIDEMIR